MDPRHIYFVEEFMKKIDQESLILGLWLQNAQTTFRFWQTNHLSCCLRGRFSIDISTPPKAVFSIFINLLNDCFMDLEGACNILEFVYM
jgi:hypothetical protein